MRSHYRLTASHVPPPYRGWDGWDVGPGGWDMEPPKTRSKERVGGWRRRQVRGLRFGSLSRRNPRISSERVPRCAATRRHHVVETEEILAVPVERRPGTARRLDQNVRRLPLPPEVLPPLARREHDVLLQRLNQAPLPQVRGCDQHGRRPVTDQLELDGCPLRCVFVLHTGQRDQAVGLLAPHDRGQGAVQGCRTTATLTASSDVVHKQGARVGSLT